MGDRLLRVATTPARSDVIVADLGVLQHGADVFLPVVQTHLSGSHSILLLNTGEAASTPVGQRRFCRVEFPSFGAFPISISTERLSRKSSTFDLRRERCRNARFPRT